MIKVWATILLNQSSSWTPNPKKWCFRIVRPLNYMATSTIKIQPLIFWDRTYLLSAPATYSRTRSLSRPRQSRAFKIVMTTGRSKISLIKHHRKLTWKKSFIINWKRLGDSKLIFKRPATQAPMTGPTKKSRVRYLMTFTWSDCNKSNSEAKWC